MGSAFQEKKRSWVGTAWAGVLADDVRKIPQRAPQFHPALRLNHQLPPSKSIPWALGFLANGVGTGARLAYTGRNRNFPLFNQSQFQNPSPDPCLGFGFPWGSIILGSTSPQGDETRREGVISLALPLGSDLLKTQPHS